MSFGTPYLIGHTSGTATSEVISVGTATSAGDVILVALGNSSASGATVSSITDSKGNSYSRALAAANTSGEFGDLWIAEGTTALATSDTITVTWSTTTGTKQCVAVGASGVATSSAVDQAPTPTHGTNSSPTVTTGTLAQAAELAIGVILSPSAESPSSISFTQVTQQQSGSSPFVTVGYEDTSSTSAVTFSGTFTLSSAWCAIVVTLLPLANVPKSDSDTGSGAESSSISATAASTETASGADAGTIGVSGTDTGAGADTSSTSAAVPGSETGTGADTAKVSVTSPDTGSGADSGSATLGATDTEAGSAAETGAITGASITAGDTGTGAESSTIAATLPASGDTGVGTDAAKVGVTSGDTGGAASEQATQAPYIRPPIVLWDAPDKLSTKGGTMA